jgi:hypothetical protein
MGRFTGRLEHGAFRAATLRSTLGTISHSPIRSALIISAKHFLEAALRAPFPASSGCSFLIAAIR